MELYKDTCTTAGTEGHKSAGSTEALLHCSERVLGPGGILWTCTKTPVQHSPALKATNLLGMY